MKILIVTKNWLGDILFEIPALRALRENFPEARLVALAPPRCRPLLEPLPYLNEVRDFDERNGERSIFSKIRLIAWLRREKFDRVFLFHRSFTRALLSKLGGIPERMGYETPKRRKILTTAVPEPSRALHQTDYFLVLLKWAGLRVSFGAPYEFFCSPEDETRASRLLQNEGLEEKAFVAFHIGANWPPKRWPPTHFARLARLIHHECLCPVVLTGSREDEKIAEEIKRERSTPSRESRPVLTRPMISLCGRTSLGTLGALYKRAAFVVSADSGPMHIASGVGTPVVALFGPTSPKLTGPRGSGKKVILRFVPPGYEVPWKGTELPKEGWMEKITAEAVWSRIAEENLWSQAREKVSSSSR